MSGRCVLLRFPSVQFTFFRGANAGGSLGTERVGQTLKEAKKNEAAAHDEVTRSLSLLSSFGKDQRQEQKA